MSRAFTIIGAIFDAALLALMAVTAASAFYVGNPQAGWGWATAAIAWLAMLQKQREVRRIRDGAWVRLDRKRRMVLSGPSVWARDDLRDVPSAYLDGGAMSEPICGRALDPHDAPLIDPDCRDGKHSSCVGGPCGCPCHELDGTA